MVNFCLTFNFAGIEGFLISSWGFQQDGKPSTHSQQFGRARLKERSRLNKVFKAGKHDFKLKSDSLRLKELIMGVVLRQLGFYSINQCFQVGKWAAIHL